MKRIAALLLLAVFGVSGVGYAVSRSVVRRHRSEAVRFPPLGPLVLDATTKAVFVGADRVETFRLAGGDYDETPGHTRDLGSLDSYTILHKGAPQGKALAAGLSAALSASESPSVMTQCFDPGVGFRVWKGRAHTDLCVCFLCSGVDVITEDARHKEVFHQRAELGGSRAAFLALSRQAFPQDAALAAVKDET